MKKVDRGNKILAQAGANAGLTKAGEGFLIASLDPCHDEKIVCEGYCDRESAPSIVQVIKRSFPVSKASGLAAGTWQFHAMIDDNLVPTSTKPVVVASGYNAMEFGGQSASVFTFPTGGLQVVQSITAAANVTVISSASTTTSLNTTSTGIDERYLKGKTRLIGQAIEVVNTSTELYKGGSITVYEMPTTKQTPAVYDAVRVSPSDRENFGRSIHSDGPRYAALDQIPVSCIWDDLAPQTKADMLLLPGSQQWDAKDGAYVVQTMSDMDNPSDFMTPLCKLYTGQEATLPSIPSTNANLAAYASVPQSVTADGVLAFPVTKFVPFHRKGIFVDGLVPEATFVINHVTIIERIINQQNPDLVVLAKPSPPSDPVATRIYEMVVREMPVGCKFSENDLGDWFLGVADSVADAAKSILHPMLGAVEGYQNARRPATTQGATYSQTPPPQQVVVVQKTAGKMKKKPNAGGQSVVRQGPRMENQKFTSPGAKAMKKKNQQ